MKKVVDMLKELRPEFDFTTSQNFIEDGMIDSFDVVSLVSMMDKEYNIKIKGREVVPENFSNLESIKALLKKYGVSDEI
ncbi:MAG: acyl carrier protein [Methanobrevibacter sp.]|nr:acyl carrier protein [Methanobrevibacter sp.]